MVQVPGDSRVPEIQAAFARPINLPIGFAGQHRLPVVDLNLWWPGLHFERHNVTPLTWLSGSSRVPRNAAVARQAALLSPALPATAMACRPTRRQPAAERETMQRCGDFMQPRKLHCDHWLGGTRDRFSGRKPPECRRERPRARRGTVALSTCSSAFAVSYTFSGAIISFIALSTKPVDIGSRRRWRAP